MNIKNLNIPGCLEIFPFRNEDNRGEFSKPYAETLFKKANLETRFTEDFFTLSKKGVIRGMHFQIPPFHYTKLVYCIHGKVFDVILDLRKGSPTYLQWEIVHLDSNIGNGVYIPPGLAHGFAALSDETIVGYKSSVEHKADHDGGVRWNSLPIPWPFLNPILSERDGRLPLLQDFDSPFLFEKL